MAMIRACMSFANLLNALVVTTLRFSYESRLVIAKAEGLLRGKSELSIHGIAKISVSVTHLEIMLFKIVIFYAEYNYLTGIAMTK